jgi:GT2 family glycosyltransferase
MQPTVYIPNLDGAGRLRLALASLEAQTADCRIVVADNASSDGSVEMTEAEFPEVEVVRMSRNRGFGTALNEAIRTVGGDPLILLNNDTECEPTFVAEMVAAAERGAEMVAGVLVQHQQPELIDSAGIQVDAHTLMAFDYLRGEPLAALDGAPAPFAPSGGAALFRREPFEAAGGFDERIFLYYEDLDLALRMRRAGAHCVLAHSARARHVGSATLGDHAAEKYVHTGWSRAYLVRRYGVMRRPANALRTLAGEAAICAGQLLLDRTAAGIVGRRRGWRAAGGLPPLEAPDNGMLELPVGRALRRRIGDRTRS